MLPGSLNSLHEFILTGCQRKKEKPLEGLGEEGRGETEAALRAWGDFRHDSSHTLLFHT